MRLCLEANALHNYRNEAHYDILPSMPNALCHMVGVGGHSGTVTAEWQAGALNVPQLEAQLLR